MALPQGSIVYTCTALYGTGKKGVVQADASGYYRMLAGAIGYANNSGDFYAETPARNCILDESASFQRKLKKGVLFGERGHPRREIGMSREDWFNRLLDIRETNTSHHIKACELVPGMRDEKGVPFTGIILTVKPTEDEGGKWLESNLNNNDINTYFSIRSFTLDVPSQGRWIKNMRMCITFDSVLEGGILPACKYQSPGLESFQDEGDVRSIFTFDEVDSALAHMPQGTGLEAMGIGAQQIKQELGIIKVDKRYHAGLFL